MAAGAVTRTAQRTLAWPVPAGVRRQQLLSRSGLLARAQRGRDSGSLPRTGRWWHIARVRATVVLGVQGRMVVPAEARKELGLAAGDELVLHTEGGRLVLERREDAAKRLRGLFSSAATHGAVDELLSDRRREAAEE